MLLSPWSGTLLAPPNEAGREIPTAIGSVGLVMKFSLGLEARIVFLLASQAHRWRAWRCPRRACLGCVCGRRLQFSKPVGDHEAADGQHGAEQGLAYEVRAAREEPLREQGEGKGQQREGEWELRGADRAAEGVIHRASSARGTR